MIFLTLNTPPGNDADGLRLSRMRTIYMLKMGAKVTNRSFGPKDANFRGFVKPLIINTLQKNKGKLALFCVYFCLL